MEIAHVEKPKRLCRSGEGLALSCEVLEKGGRGELLILYRGVV